MFRDGVLFFPVTPLTADDRLDLDALAEHVRRQLAFGPAAVFVACGTGELHALGPAEYGAVVRTTVDVTGGRVPVFAGAGGPVGLARLQAEAARAAGADGLLLLPPYLVRGPQAGLARYVRSVCAATELDVILYNRDSAVFDVTTAVELAALDPVIGFKDGSGDLDAVARVVVAVRASLRGTGKQFTFFNGLPTAEVTVPAYRAIGVSRYSSAVFCFAPELATAFYTAIEASDSATVERLLTGFFHPLVALRDQVPGYAVALVKAAVTLRGLPVGPVRPPLVEPSADHLEQLEQIVADGLALVDATAPA